MAEEVDYATCGRELLDVTLKRDPKIEEKIKNLFGGGCSLYEVFACYMLPQLIQKVPVNEHKWIPDILDNAIEKLTFEEKKIYLDEAKKLERKVSGKHYALEEIAYAVEI